LTVEITEDEVRAIATWLAAKLGNKAEAARWCGVPRGTLQYWLDPETKRESTRRYREANREANRERNRRYHEARKNDPEYREDKRERARSYYEANRDAERERSRRWREANRDTVRHMVQKKVGTTTQRLRNCGTKTPPSLRRYIRENVEAMCGGITDDDVATWCAEYDLDHVRPLGMAACDSAQDRGETRPGFSGPADPHLMAVLHVSNLRWMRKADHHQKTTQDNADIARAGAVLRMGA
jgi:hypothetical protein